MARIAMLLQGGGAAAGERLAKARDRLGDSVLQAYVRQCAGGAGRRGPDAMEAAVLSALAANPRVVQMLFVR